MAIYPAAMLPALKQIPAQSRIFNEYLWGGYLEWLSRDHPVFIDSRVDIFEYNSILRDYLNIIQLDNSIELLDHYKIDHVLFKEDLPLIYLLQHTQGWTTRKQDHNFILMDHCTKFKGNAADKDSTCIDNKGPDK